MFVVLHPSMCDIENKTEHEASNESNTRSEKTNDTGSNNKDGSSSNINNNNSSSSDRSRTEDHRFFKKNETTIASGPSSSTSVVTMVMPPQLLHAQSRIRSYFMSYRRHRYFRRSLFVLWSLAVYAAIHANWLAATGESFLTSVAETLEAYTATPVHVCFITAQYASSTEQLDSIVNLREEQPSFFADRNRNYFHFFAFTNRRDFIEAAASTTITTKTKDKSKATGTGTATTTKTTTRGKDNGWTILVKEFPAETFQRFITQSRWPKFQGFRDERIQETCDVVFYMDGTVMPVGSPNYFQKFARKILASDVKLSQGVHPKTDLDGGGIDGEFHRIRSKSKDIESNIEKSMEWFRAQPDYTNNCVLHHNTFFGYALESNSFRAAADFAWGRFSLEQDSWRDQPLWCYTLHHFGITPVPLPEDLFMYQGERRSSNDHKYGAEAANNAQKYYEQNNQQERSATGGGGTETTNHEGAPASTATSGDIGDNNSDNTPEEPADNQQQQS